MRVEHRISEHHELIYMLIPHHDKGLVEVSGIANLDDPKAYAECSSGALECFERRSRVRKGRIREDGDASYARHRFLQYL